MMCITVLHGGVCHRTSTPHKSENKMKEKKIFTIFIYHSWVEKNIGSCTKTCKINSYETMTTGKYSIDDFRYKSILSQQRLTIDYQNISV